MSQETSLDVAKELAQLRQAVKERREKLHGSELSELRALVRQVNERWNVSAHLPITWGGPPLVGRGLAYAKRATRLLLALVHQPDNRAAKQLTPRPRLTPDQRLPGTIDPRGLHPGTKIGRPGGPPGTGRKKPVRLRRNSLTGLIPLILLFVIPRFLLCAAARKCWWMGCMWRWPRPDTA